MKRTRLPAAPARKPAALPAVFVRSTALQLLLAAATLTQAGCGGGFPGSDVPLATRFDSAGVTVIEYRLPATAELPRWEVAAEPSVVIGALTQSADHQLQNVRGITRTSDGSIIVALAANEVRVFDSTGAFVQNIGRAGAGPGEFSNLSRLWRLAGDRVLVRNEFPRLHQLFDPRGTLLQAYPPGEKWRDELQSRFSRFVISDVMSDGSLLVYLSKPPPPPPEIISRTDSSHLFRIDSAGSVLTDYGVHWDADIVRIARSGLEPDSAAAAPPPTAVAFTARRALKAHSHSSFAYARPDQFGLQIWSADGVLRNVVRVQTNPVPKTLADSDVRMIRGARFDYGAAVQDPLPPLLHMKGSVDGNFWLSPRAGALPAGMDRLVFDTTGALLAYVDEQEPIGGRALQWTSFSQELSSDYVLTVAVDSLGVEHVLLYGVRRPGG